MKELALRDLAQYPLCDFFLRKCVESMNPDSIAEDLRQDTHRSLLQHFNNPAAMTLLENMFAGALETFRLTKEELKRYHEFNFDSYDIDNFESARGVLRFSRQLTLGGFTDLSLLQENGLADLGCSLKEERWLVEVKTLTQRFGELDGLIVDKHQPVSRKIADYIEELTSSLADRVPYARKQLLLSQQRRGPEKTMVGIVINWPAAGFFVNEPHLTDIYNCLRGRAPNWEQDYLQGIDCLAFLIDDRLTKICN